MNLYNKAATDQHINLWIKIVEVNWTEIMELN